MTAKDGDATTSLDSRVNAALLGQNFFPSVLSESSLLQLGFHCPKDALRPCVQCVLHQILSQLDSRLWWYMVLSCSRCRAMHLSLLNFTALLLARSSNLLRSLWTEALHSCVSIAYVSFTPWSGDMLGKQSCVVVGTNVEQHS